MTINKNTNTITVMECKFCDSPMSGFPYGADESEHCLNCGAEWEPLPTEYDESDLVIDSRDEDYEAFLEACEYDREEKEHNSELLYPGQYDNYVVIISYVEAQLDDAGCNNGNYPAWTGVTEDGSAIGGTTCRCRGGCHGLDRITIEDDGEVRLHS